MDAFGAAGVSVQKDGSIALSIERYGCKWLTLQ
jgi:hypothetical protein